MSSFFLNKHHAWINGNDHPIAISSRIRLARNLDAYPFPRKAGPATSEEILLLLKPVLEKCPALLNGWCKEMIECSEQQRLLLFERHLISRELMTRGVGSGVAISGDEQISVMVNEEDHLRIQVMQPGFDLKKCWERATALDDHIESRLSYAFSPKLGYLTSCPTNVGTGMRASVMLHLPALVITEDAGPIINGLSTIGLVVRGLWGEGTEAVGNMFQISNQITLGEPEPDMIHTLEQIVEELVQHEFNARKRLEQKKRLKLDDYVWRAYGTLMHARVMGSEEALNMLSALRLGVESGIVRDVDKKCIDELLMTIQPGHLQEHMGEPLKPEARDISRAVLIRKTLNKNTKQDEL
ncbi:MAG: protein arginine kinase [Spartobacteria bacterium]|nr:protein arginine kinase [Spartobacteria bacterium]